VKRILVTLLSLFALAAGLLTAGPAQAAPVAQPALTGCPSAEKWEWPAGKHFSVGECYRTPGGTFYMQHDGNLVIYDGGGNPMCDSGTYGWSGATADFQYDENFVLYYYGYPIAWSATIGNPPGALIFNRNARLRIRNAQGFIAWDMCRDGFYHP
jgi:hypothetical protein